ncbi:MAG: hypothetical protein LJE94_06325 [Deltaproteobacteria bacterium]|nr:hypothetical protein [Deltaproteobacteria bacterium]
MTIDQFTYDVRCRTCHKKFTVELFESHEKNLFLVDKRDWYCDKCKKAYFSKQTETLSRTNREKGFPPLTGTEKMISWAEKIRAELINKVDYLQKSLAFDSEEARAMSDRAFEAFMAEWQKKTTAKWWIDNRRMTVMDISKRVKALSAPLEGQD